MFKKFICPLAIILLAIPCVASATTMSDEQSVIIRKPHTPGIKPKAPAVAPFSCTVDPEEGLLRVYFTGDLGQVVISVNEMATGVTTSMTVDSSDGTAQILLSGDPGFYHVTFCLESGDLYEGEFMI